METHKETLSTLFGNVPEVRPSITYSQLSLKLKESFDCIIVLDDDPTGTQTVHDIPVLTTWSKSAIGMEIRNKTPLFYILTNSRSFPALEAENLGKEIAENIKYHCESKGTKCLVISRSDSTLRGHYPMEVQILIESFGNEKPVQFIIPAFLEGGRFTINDIHYVQEENYLIPAGETAFAKDKVFGYQSSNLKDWVLEKSKGNYTADQIHSLSLDEIANDSIKRITSKINSFSGGDICIINVANHEFLKKAVFAILSSDVNPYFRSAASLVSTLAGQSPKLVDISKFSFPNNHGGLTVLGSYVPKSTSQLNHTLLNLKIESIEINIEDILTDKGPVPEYISKVVDDFIEQGKDVILYTSRELISTNDPKKNLEIGLKVSYFLTEIVSKLKIQPKFIIGKGGITSSDLATKSLKIKRAMVLGQLITGVPLWKPESESKFPDIPYIVFPGNVGDQSALTRVINILNAKDLNS